jgi:hypothetical protein
MTPSCSQSTTTTSPGRCTAWQTGPIPITIGTFFNGLLERERSSAWALFGLKKTHEAKGNSGEAKKADEALSRAWRGDKAMLTLERL